jgi:LacI family transcriptional regulator, repressor for deo operon, udp, cdd, tsx, nupC, and nupG
VKVGLGEVARRVGVSESTVSRVVNDRPGVRDETRIAVRRAIDELGYEPPGLHLQPGDGLVGLIVPELRNPIFPTFAQAIETELAAHGYTCVLCTAERGAIQEPAYIDVLVGRRVSGIVVVSGLHANVENDHSLYANLIGRGMPLVMVNGFVESLGATFVSCDEHHAATIAVRHLASLGHTAIGAAMGPKRYVPVQRRTRGYVDAMQHRFGGHDPRWLATTHFTVEGGHAAAHELLRAGCTAIVCGSDLMALGAIRAAAERGVRVPDDVSIVGYDDTVLMEFVDPPLTTIRQPVVAMSSAIVQSLLERSGGSHQEGREYLFRPELVVRGSIGPAPVVASSPKSKRKR